MITETSVLTHMVIPWEYQAKNDKNSNSTTKYSVPKSFLWSDGDIGEKKITLDAPVIDLNDFTGGEKSNTKHIVEALRTACLNHGFFQVVNHGIDPELLDQAYKQVGFFFKRPTSEKICALKKQGSVWGLALAHSDRFSSNLPWKETMTFPYHAKGNDNMIEDYFTSVMGNAFKETGIVYQKYCKEMQRVSLIILKLLAITLGVEDTYYTKVFEDATSIMRMNYYPPCGEPDRVLGTPPHCDPTSITMLYQDHVGGLEVLVDDKWQFVEPQPGALVINIGDTIMAMTNGIYKSCLHRALVNDNEERVSMAFFLCPREDKVVRSPPELGLPRNYPDFSWLDFMDFTQNHYRVDTNTLKCFTKWQADNLATKNIETSS